MTEAAELRRLQAVFSRVLQGMQPPDDITVTEWAERKRKLSTEASAEPGAWRTDRTPYLRAPMDAFTDPHVRRIVMVAASQVGKSEFINNTIGYIIDQDPGSILLIQPTTIDAKEYSKLRIAPMIRDCPTLRHKVSASKSRDSGNTILQKAYPGGILTLCGSTEAHALASKPIRYVFGDERDRWATSAGDEGDPWALAMARQKTFYNAKAIEVSTPTVLGASAIASSYAKGTMERWQSQCPHCGAFHEITFSNIHFAHGSRTVAGQKTFTVQDIVYVCPHCACAATEQEMKRQPAKWVAIHPEAYAQGVRSFWLSAFVSTWASWEGIILDFLYADGDSRKLQVVYNTAFGELWEDRGDTVGENDLLARRETYAAELPEGVLVLTCGVDTQDDRLEYEVVGYGFFGETWGIAKGVILGKPNEDATWQALDAVLDRTYRFADGLGLPISTTFVDEGGHYTQQVRLQCRARASKQVYPIKGRGGQDIPYTAPPKKQKIILQKRYLGECWSYSIGVNAGKQMIFDKLRVGKVGANYCHFPRADAYGEGFFKGLLSEHLVYRKGRKNPWVWEKIPGHERNEALDCRNYANAAFEVCAANLDAIDKRLKALRHGASPQLQAAPTTQPPRQKKTHRFDDW